MAVTKELVEKVFNEFQKAHNNNVAVELKQFNKPKDIYGSRITEKENSSWEAAYYPSTRRLVIFSANIRDEERLRTAINHEILGHYGINTLNREEKRIILDRISAARDEPTLKQYWKHVDNNYSGLTEPKKAEEVFAYIAEYDQKFVRSARNQSTQSDILSSDLKPLNRYELRAITESIDNGITKGIRKLQIIPENDHEQFRKNNLNHAHVISPYLAGKSLAFTQVQSAQSQQKPTNIKTLKSEARLDSSKPLLRGR